MAYVFASRPATLGPVDAQYRAGMHDGAEETLSTLLFLTTNELFEQRREREASARSAADAALAELERKPTPEEISTLTDPN